MSIRAYTKIFMLVFALLVSPSFVHAQTFVPENNEFVSAVIMQPDTHKILWSFKPDTPHPAASLSKLATALAFLDSNPSWDKLVKLSSVDEVGGGRLRVADGAMVSLRDLFYSALTSSANNAAMALGRLGSSSMAAFVAQMNAEAKRVGATHSVFYEPAGINPKNTVTAYDVARLAEAVFKNQIAHSASTISQYAFTVRNTGEYHVIQNTNKPFLQDPDVWLLGGKTGFLYESKYNLVAELEPLVQGKPDPSRKVIVVVLGSDTYDKSFNSIKKMSQWAWDHPELFATSIAQDALSKTLVYGSRDQDVRTLQEWLAKDEGIYPEALVTGYFGTLTLQAVQRFQLKYGVVKYSSDTGYGIVGPATRAKVYEFAVGGAQPATKADPAQVSVQSVPSKIQQTLVYGQVNDQVRYLQSVLKNDKAVYPEGIESGLFGPLTLQAVQRFQLKYGVVKSSSDTGYGIVGPATRAKLQEFAANQNA